MQKTKSRLTNHDSKEKYLLAFLIGFCTLLISLIPILIADKGYFIYYGDYNAQQIPFYNLVNNAVREGQFAWNWFTDLGSDLIGSYSFYLIGSPYFWLTTILPKALITLSMPILLCLKHGMATLTAYAYIRRFVRNKDAAIIGGLLYAFSGFQIYNIFFNHFQDVTSFFPLMLIALENLINSNKRGVFALTVTFMAVLNYFFFTGQVVFLIIYFIFRCFCKDFNATPKKFFMLLSEAIIGTLIAAVILLPSAMIILDNYRVSERLYGTDLLLYADSTRIPRIIQSFFMPVDMPANPNLFSSPYAKWSSIGGYFPLFSMVGVIAFIKKNKKHWSVKLFFLCILFAFVPVLNSSFYMFNSSYYARWYYMPILILAMMTAYALDDEEINFSSGIKISGIVLGLLAISACLPTKNKDEIISYFSLPEDPAYFWLTLALAVVFLIITTILHLRKTKNLSFIKPALWLTIISCIACTITGVTYGACTPKAAQRYIESAIKGTDNVYEHVDSDNFFRVDMSEGYDNYPMIWGLPSMRAFQSVVSPSIMEFYDNVDVQRDVASRADTSHYSLRALLSIKYYYQYSDKSEDVDIPNELHGFELVDQNDYFDIYENKLYIPMGFAYDKYITTEKASTYSKLNVERSLLQALVLSDEQVEKYNDILTECSDNDVYTTDYTRYISMCKEKQSVSSSSFTYDSYGFTSEISLDKPQLVFFSVPYSKGWSAEVNGEKVDVEKVSYGFMAVKASSGENTIVFKYRTPGLYEGLIITIIGVLLLIAYLFITKRFKPNTFNTKHYYDYNSTCKIQATHNYEKKLKKSIWSD